MNLGDRPNDVADILASLLTSNLETYPARANIARQISRPVAVYNTYTGTVATVVFHDNRAVVYNNLVGRPLLIVKGIANQIVDVTKLTTAPALRRILRRRLAVKGLLLHPVTALQLLALISTS
ncbi:MAG TPA: hypothetical protein VLJ59_01245 [Mycobacteriales bacterium]|nr:hypothetical protein [Mycobacteriales bacterium]